MPLAGNRDGVEDVAQMQKEECLSLFAVTVRKYPWLHTLSRRRVILTLASGAEAERWHPQMALPLTEP